MTVRLAFFDWQAHGIARAYSSCSPNLLLVLEELTRRWPFFDNMGCYQQRPIRGSADVPSSHTYGAAIDVGYPADEDPTVDREVCGFLVAWSSELGVDAVHDYRRCRIWRGGRTMNVDDACTTWWKAQRPSGATGMGQKWANHLHLETPPTAWGLTTPMAERGIL